MPITIFSSLSLVRIAPLVLCLVLTLVGNTVVAQDEDVSSVTITVHSGARQKWEGLGANGGPLSRGAWLDDAQKVRTLRTVNEELEYVGGRFYRVYITGWPDGYIVAHFEEFMKTWHEVNPDIQFVFNPTGTMVDPDSWGNRIADLIYLLEKTHGKRIQWTGVGNEPNQSEFTWAAPIQPSDMPAVIKSLRRALNSKGLTHVKIMAPGPSNCDQYMWDCINKIKSDPEALSILDAWEYHSYNMSLTEKLSQAMSNPPKLIWQTEASLPEGDPDLNDSMSAAQTLTRLLADLNFGPSYWLHWNNLHPRISGASIANFNEYNGQVFPLLKYYYFRQFVRTIVPGTMIRKCTTDFPLHEGWRSENKWMSYSHGRKIPLAASAGVRPDGSWGLAAVNHTGIRFTDYGSTYYPAQTITVTFDVEELAGGDSTEFLVWRCNDGTRNVLEDEPTYMVDGKITVDVKHCELVCLSTTFDTRFNFEISAGRELTGGSVSDCGSGIFLACLPPAGFCWSTRFKKKRKRAARNEA